MDLYQVPRVRGQTASRATWSSQMLHSKLRHRDDIRVTSLPVYRIVAEGRSIIPEVDVKFLPPVMHMDKLACVGLNYSGHCQEQGIPIPESPIIFSKFPSNIIGPRDNILLPPISDVSRQRIRRVEFIIIGDGKRKREKEREKVCVCVPENRRIYCLDYTIRIFLIYRDYRARPLLICETPVSFRHIIIASYLFHEPVSPESGL